METTHDVHVGDARSLDELDDDAVDLVVTSPPYPMIEMWDGLFSELDPAVGDALDAGDGQAAFAAMHDALSPVWDELARVLAPGGVACINVGDATRTVDGDFQLYPNHAEIVSRLSSRGLSPLPDVLWRKPTNSPSKFVGSGMLPTNAYVTLEHEYVLVFRNGGTRSFPAGSDRRYESAYFWEERNRWFSDVWTELAGERQHLDDDALRERSGAFPFELPYRLVCMFSVYDDTVLDPFWGTGTTSLAAMAAGRNSVGYELDAEFARAFDDQVTDVPGLSRAVIDDRLARHRAFVENNPGKTNYDAEHYDVPVVTKQERDLRFYEVTTVERRNGVDGTDAESVGRRDGDAETHRESGRYVARHEPYQPSATTASE